MKNKKLTRLLSIIMSITMVVTMLPFYGITAFAGETYKGKPETIYVQTKTSTDRDTNINADWKFNMTTADCSTSTYNDSAWSTVQLPHDFSIYQNFTTSGEAESGFLPGGTGWYRKKMTIPASQNGKRFELNFDGAYMHTYVYVNGSYVGENHYGYNSFAFDITDKLTCDGSTENVIAVKVVHNTPSSRWYSGSGIYRDVTLTVTDPVHIAHNGLTITTPNISSGNGTVNAVAKVQNQSTSPASVSVKATIFEKGSDTAVANATSTGTVNANSTSNITVTPVVSSPKLWSLDNPNLYEAKIEVSVGGTVVDTYTDSFGFRYFDWSRTNGFSLNGTRVQLQGVCMHHDQGALGSAAYYDAMYRQMANMKNMGVNAIRATHNPYDKDFYKICDELGLLVIEELFDGWVAQKNGNSKDASEYWNTSLTATNTVIGGSTSMKWPEFVTKEIVQRDVNRPSVFAWSLCNEVCQGTSGFNSSTSATIAANLCTYVKSIDGTRTITCGDDNVKSGTTTQSVNQAIINAGGVIGLNYCNNDQYNSIFNNSFYSSWTFYGSETSSAINSRDRYMSQSSGANIDNNYHLTSFDTSTVGWGKTANDSMYTTLSESRIAGEYIWTGWDYIGEPTPWNGTGSGSVIGSSRAYPNSSYFGIVDTAGFEKDTYYFYRSQWGDKVGNTTHLVTAWDSDNYMLTNSKVPVVLYSNAYKVEIYRNGTLMGTATRTDRTNTANVPYHTYSVASNNSNYCEAVSAGNNGTSLYATFNIAYEAGTLSTKSYDKSGNLISESTIEGRYKVSTPGNVSKIIMTKDKEEILADGSSLAYFTVDLTDASGNRDTMSSKLIKFDITGNGEIMGCDNGDQATTQKFQQPSVLDVNNRTTAQIYGYAGKALCIVRSTKKAGSFTLTASSPSSEFASVSQSVTTVSDDSSQSSLENGDINSYTFIRNYTVRERTEPTFDTKATATKLGSDKEFNGTVNWSTVPSSFYNKAGDYTINGTLTVEGESFSVTGTLHVIDSIAGVKNISTVTRPGIAPKLPDTVNGLSSDGTETGLFNVTWDKVNANDFIANTTVVVNGNVDYFGENMPVTASVRVENANISISDVTDTVVEYSSDSQNSGFSSLNDNNLDAKAWSNASTKNTSDISYIKMRWDTARIISSIKLAYYFDSNAIAPEDIDIQYSLNSTDFESVGYTGPAEELVSGKLYEYKLDDDINPIAIRIVFTQQGRTVNGNCVALSELKLYENTYSIVEANDSASLDSIEINGQAIDGFKSNKYSYTSITVGDNDVVTATSSDNAAVTVLPTVDRSVAIVVLSEDGKTSKIYTLGKTTVQPTPDVTTEKYKFDFKNSTPTTLETGSSLKTLTDNAGHTLNYMLWQASSVTTGQYMKIQDAFINTPSTIDTGIKGDCWNVVYRYNKTTTDKPNATLIGLGTTGGSGSMADLIYITADGYIETGFTNTSSNQSTSVGKSLYNTSASSPEELDIGYDNGIVTVKYNDEVVFTKDISSNETLNNKFKNGVGSFFIGANKYVSAGGTYSDTSHNSSGQAAYIQKLYDLTGSVTVKGTSGSTDIVQEAENIAPKATVTSNVSDSLTPLTDGNKEYSDSNRVINWNVRSQGQMTVTFTWDKLYELDYTNIDFYSEGWGTFPPKQLDIYASTDGSSFGSTPIMSYTNDGSNMPSVSSSANVYEKKYEFPANTKVKALKFVATVRDGSISSGKFATGFAEIEIFTKEITGETTDPEEPSETEEYVADTTAIDSAMRTFETKVASGKIYKNIYNAYQAYTECQKARDAAKYGHDNSIDLAAKTQALTTATNAMTEWTMSMPTDVSKVSARFSSYDNATNNKQYFKSALYITQSDDPYVVSNNPGHAWFGVYYHNGTYIYDGTNAIEVPVMLMTIPYKNPFYFFSAYLTGQNSAVSLKGRWFGSDGPGSGQARKYYYYHDESSLQSNSSDYYNRRFSFPSTSSYNNNSTYNDSKIGDLSGKSNWNLATTNTFVINGATLFPSGNKTVSTDVSFGTINMHTYNSTSLSSPWINTYSLGTQVKVINQKGLKDRVTTYTEKFKNVSNYKENGLNWAADGINRFASLDYNITAQAAGTLTADMTTAHNSFNSADSSTPVDSADYAALRTALDSASFTTNDNCYSKSAFDNYITARNNAIAAMKNVGKNGYVTSYNNKTIKNIALALSTATSDLTSSERIHNYGVGVYNSATKQIVYTCKNNIDHTSVVEASAYVAAIEEVKETLKDTKKYKAQAIKNITSYLDENGCLTLIGEDNSVSQNVNQTTIDTFTTTIKTMCTDLTSQRINIKRFDIDYSYQKNKEEILTSGIVVDARYGDWLTESEYSLQDNESVYKWTVEDENGTKTLSNTTTHFNILITNNESLVCYITDGTEEAPAGQNKVTFIDNVGKIGNIEFCNSNTEYTVDANTVKNSAGNTVYTAKKPPFYQVTGFRVGSKIYNTGDTITITKDENIYPVYTAEKEIKIYTSGSEAGSALINGDYHSGEAYAYTAYWDEEITVEYNAGGSRAMYWYINGVLVGYGTTYKFRANSNAVITAKNNEDYDLPSSTVSYFKYDVDNNKVTAVVSFYAGANGTVENAGVVLSTAYSDKENIIAHGKKFASTRFTKEGNQTKISVSRTAGTSFTMYAVPYVVVNGTTYYGDLSAPIVYPS